MSAWIRELIETTVDTIDDCVEIAKTLWRGLMGMR